MEDQITEQNGKVHSLTQLAKDIFSDNSSNRENSKANRPSSNLVLMKPVLNINNDKSDKSVVSLLEKKDSSIPLDSEGEDVEGDMNESDNLLNNEKRRVSTTTAGRLRKAVLVISWVSLVVLGGLGCATLVIGILYNSPSSFAFSLDAILDCASSLVIIWRFYSAAAVYDNKKEKIACICLGVLFILSAFSVVIRSTEAIKNDVKPSKDNIIWCMATANGAVCLILFTGYVYLAKMLESVSLFTDSIIAAIGFFLAVATVAGDLVYENNSSIWYLDPLIGLVCSGFLMLYGIVIILHEVVCHKKKKEEDEDLA